MDRWGPWIGTGDQLRSLKSATHAQVVSILNEWKVQQPSLYQQFKMFETYSTTANNPDGALSIIRSWAENVRRTASPQALANPSIDPRVQQATRWFNDISAAYRESDFDKFLHKASPFVEFASKALIAYAAGSGIASEIGAGGAGAGGAGGSAARTDVFGNPLPGTITEETIGAGATAAGAGSAAGGGGIKTALIKGGIGIGLDKLLNKQSSAERDLARFSRAPFESEEIQRFLPPSLRQGQIGPFLDRGVANIGNLISRPGGLGPGVAEAIAPRLAAESQTIGQNFRNLQSQNEGTMARGNVPVSLKGAVQSALGIAQERAQRGARSSALLDSENLRRSDVSQTYNLLDAINQFTSSGRGIGTQTLGTLAGAEQNREAARLALFGNILSGIPFDNKEG